MTFILSNEDYTHYITFPFKYEFYDPPQSSSLSEEEKIVKKLSLFSAVTEINVGRPPQKIKMNISSNRYYFYLISSVLNNELVKGFNQKASETAERREIPPLVNEEDGIEFYELEDLMIISPDVKVYQKYFCPLILLFNKTTEKYQRNGGTLGFDVEPGKYDRDFNIVYSSRSRMYIINYDFFLNFTSKNEGNIVLGAFPWNFTNLTENDFYSGKAETLNNRVHWSFVIQNFYIGNKEFNFLDLSLKNLIAFEDYFFTAPFNFYKLFKENFFQSYLEKQICSELNINDGYIYIYCNKK